MDRRVVLGAVAALAVVDVALWFAVFDRSSSPVASSSNSEVGGEGQVSTASPDPSASARPTASPRPKASPEPTTSPEPTASTASAEPPEEQPRVEITSGRLSGTPFETVPVRGVLHGVAEATTLRVQHRQQGRWVSFPLRTTTDATGRFTAYVEMGTPGRHQLRVRDARTGVTSPVVTVRIR